MERPYLKSMTVKALMERLSKLNPEAEVCFGYTYGDHWRSELSAPVRNVEDDTEVEWSDYHRSYKVFRGTDEDREFDPEDTDSKKVVLLGD